MTTRVCKTILDSGLTIVTEEMDHVETAAFGAFVSVGARNEQKEENGVAHFLEHMAFKGTDSRSALEIAETIENVGGYINAYTSRETTAYYVKLLADHLPLGIDLIGDILTHSTLKTEEIERERGVILQEIGQANDTPDDIIFDVFQECAYPDQAMGRSILGPQEIIGGMNRDGLLSYMTRHYHTGSIIIAAAGKLRHADVVARVEKAFADLGQGDAPSAPAAIYDAQTRHMTRQLDQTHLLIGFEGPSHLDPDYYAASLLSCILGGGMSSRLFQEIREKRGLVYSVYSFLNPFRDSGLFGIYAGTSPTQVEELLPAAMKECSAIRNGVTPEELNRAKSQVKASLLMSLESTSSRCSQLARHMQVYGRVIPASETIAKIEAITEQDILRAASRILSSKPVFSTIGTENAGLPSGPQLLNFL